MKHGVFFLSPVSSLLLVERLGHVEYTHQWRANLWRMRVRTVLLLLGALACGGKLDASICENSFAVDASPESDVALGTMRFGTAVSFDSNSLVQQQTDVRLVFTPQADGCPAPFAFGLPVSSDIVVMMIGFAQYSASNFVGHYPLDMHASEPQLSRFAVGVIKAGSYTIVDAQPAIDGSVDIIEYVPNVHVAGRFAYTRADSSVVSADFDVPFCGTQCGGP